MNGFAPKTSKYRLKWISEIIRKIVNQSFRFRSHNEGKTVIKRVWDF